MPAEDASFVEVVSEMYRLFGTRRMMELLGWGTVIGAASRDGDTPADIRERLMKLGFSRAAAYRATADLRDLGRSLEKRRGETVPVSEVLREINAADKSLLGDFVVK